LTLTVTASAIAIILRLERRFRHAPADQLESVF
jgi:hypothetical protein